MRPHSGRWLTGLMTCCLTHFCLGMEWSDLNTVEQAETGYKTTGADPWMLSEPMTPLVQSEAHCLLVEVRSAPTTMQLYWMNEGEGTADERSVLFHVNSPRKYTTYAIDLGAKGTFHGAARYRLDPSNRSGFEFDVKRIEFVQPKNVPAELLPQLVKFRCYTSKLHYQPGERIGYRAALSARCYPDRQSSKMLHMILRDAAGKEVASVVRQYGLRPNLQFKEIQGVFDVSGQLPSGQYVLHARSIDQRTGFELTARHEFGIQGKDDPYVCETPFKFVKDFSFVRGPDHRWHVFSITGDFFGNHDWTLDGQERTFSHTSSANLRDWTIHPPVISISNDKHPDGNGRFKDRNVWAPHVIEHDGRYWMFYTSVNQPVSQSVSLATSKDLFEWVEYEKNPVFTLEDVAWANWRRNGWADCRDPCVLKDGDKFYLYVTANAKPPGECGAVAVAESDDLVHWRNASIAVRAKIISESPHAWKIGDTYCMTTSSHGAATYVSNHPMRGWKRADFPRPDIASFEPYVRTSRSYAEEVCVTPAGEYVMAALTFRHYGNTIYFFRMQTDDGKPVGYESPW